MFLPGRPWTEEPGRLQSHGTAKSWTQLRYWTLTYLCYCVKMLAAAKLLQSCPTLCDPIDSSPPGSPVPGILQARTLEWVAISFSNTWKWKVKVKSLSHVQLLATLWTAACQAPPSMGFSRQQYWSGCHCLLCCARWGCPNDSKSCSWPESAVCFYSYLIARIHIC